MSLKNLPASLINAVGEILIKSAENDQVLYQRVVEEGTKLFELNAADDTTHPNYKAFNSWLTKKLQTIKETTTLSQEGEERASDLAKQAFHNAWKEETKEAEKAASDDEEKTVVENAEELAENIAIAPDQLASNGAVGVRDASKRTPVHADVLRDTAVVENKTEFRMLVQFPTNERSIIVPPVTLPGAPSVAALREIVEGLPYFCECMKTALESAENAPHNEPNFKGSGNDAVNK